MALLKKEANPSKQDHLLNIAWVESDTSFIEAIRGSFQKHPELFYLDESSKLEDIWNDLNDAHYDALIINAESFIKSAQNLGISNLRDLACPVIITDYHYDDARASSILNLGASDYIANCPSPLKRMAYITMRAMREWRYIQERELANAFFENEQPHFRAIFDSSLDAIMLVRGNDGLIFDCNEAFVRQFGYQRIDIFGRHFSTLFTDQDKKNESSHVLKRIRVHGTVFERQYFVDAEGKSHPMDVTATVIPWKQDYAMLVTLRNVAERVKHEDSILREKMLLKTRIEDATRELVFKNQLLIEEIETRKQDEIELEKLNQALRESLNREQDLGELKSAFVNMVSHEFRTPLAAIRSTIEVLNRYWDRLEADERNEHFQNIERSAHNITQMMEELLILGQIQSGKLSFKPAPFDPEKLWQNLMMHLDGHKDAIQRLNQSIEIIDQQTPYGDMRLIIHIMLNLVTNALKYSEDMVKVNIRLESGMIQIEIIDKGIGIPQEEQSRLHELFYRATNTENIKGVGVGMFIAHQCACLHRGNLICESDVGKGSTFRALLPVTIESFIPDEITNTNH